MAEKDKSIDYPNQKFVYLFKDKEKKTFGYPLDRTPDVFNALVEKHGCVDFLDVVKG